ncbi:vWA domain-containing protein [Nitratifractor sp.]
MAAGGVASAVAEKLARARARLMLESPWLGSMAAELPLAADEDLMAFEADGERLRYRPGFFEEAGVEAIEFALANGALHRLLEHRERRGRRDPRLWQLATDHAINALLDANGFFVPDFARGFERYANRYAESIYEELAKEHPPREEEPDETEEEPREASERAQRRREERRGEDRPERRGPPRRADAAGEETSLSERLARERMESLARHYGERGELPEGIEILLPELAPSRRDWREELHRFFDPFVKNDYRFYPPNLKHLYRGVSLPALASERLRIAVAIDSSGSIDRELLATFFSELEAILEQFPDYHIDLIVADDRVRSHQIYETGEPLACEPTGGGGTDFRPVFNYIGKEMDPPLALLYFTDGMGIFPAEEPPYEVLWVLSVEREVPFGRRVFTA